MSLLYGDAEAEAIRYVRPVVSSPQCGALPVAPAQSAVRRRALLCLRKSAARLRGGAGGGPLSADPAQAGVRHPPPARPVQLEQDEFVQLQTDVEQLPTDTPARLAFALAGRMGGAAFAAWPSSDYALAAEGADMGSTLFGGGVASQRVSTRQPIAPSVPRPGLACLKRLRLRTPLVASFLWSVTTASSMYAPPQLSRRTATRGPVAPRAVRDVPYGFSCTIESP
eukprot:1599020-Prymnesium_polylepis.1